MLNYFTGLDSMKMHYCAIVATGQLCKFEGQPMRSLSSSCETIDLDPACCILYTQNFLAKEVFLSEVMYVMPAKIAPVPACSS